MDGHHETATRVALVTGASRGLGRALAERLLRDGWRVIVDARDGARLAAAAGAMPAPHRVTAIAGDVADPRHRRELAAAAADAGRLDLLVNNASVLGPTPLRPLAEHPPDAAAVVVAVNTLAPLALVQEVLPLLAARDGRVVNVSSDAAVEAYAGWGVYGAAKAALDHLTAVLAVERPRLRAYAVDPGDMDTELQRQAGGDGAGLPAPEAVVPALMRLIEGDLPSGRYRAAALAAAPTA